MKLLVVSPDYASHALPLIELGRAWAAGWGEVVVATGPATRPLVEAAGLDWVDLRLGRGSNAGVIEVAEQPSGEDEHLLAFFEATRRGPVETLRYQADARCHDLLHAPDRVLDRLAVIVREQRPDRVVVDHVAFGARLALHALDMPVATVVLGHPSALVGDGEVYGLPPAWPSAMVPEPADLVELADRCRRSVRSLSDAAGELLARRAPQRMPVGDLTATAGSPTLLVYPRDLHDERRVVAPGTVFLGALVRSESLGAVRLPTGRGPRVTVALGSFLSARGDVLATVIRAAHLGGWRLALAHGSTPLADLPAAPAGALVQRHIPQVALLEHTDVVVHHGGNGSVTEAAAAGTPMVVLPFSTDQFAGAAAVERAGLGSVLAPNTLTAEALVEAVAVLMRSDAADRARSVAAAIAGAGGARAGAEAIAR